jgi:hypothetical protein
MNVGDLVRPTTGSMRQEDLGVVIGKARGGNRPWVVVYWNDKYPTEVEDRDYLEVISENR